MKILVIGSNGFIGKAVCHELRSDHEVFCADRSVDADFKIDLLEKESIRKVLTDISPEIIINCAGVVENSEKAILTNPVVTLNLLQVISELKVRSRKIVLTGSAGEYGEVMGNEAVKEEVALRAESFYGRSKILESSVALYFKDVQKLPVVIARIFNPIGIGMHPRFLLPKIIATVSGTEEGKAGKIEVNRLDARRDYIDVRDVAGAIKDIAEKKTKHSTYNIGSGISTSNKELIDIIIKESGLREMPQIIESSNNPEPHLADRADIGRIKSDLGWIPKISLENTVKEIIKNK